MPKLLFTAAYIRFVDLRYDEKSKTAYTKINFTAAFTEPVREAMEWGEPPAGFASATLDGEFTASHLILTPKGKELKDHELQINAKEIHSFELVRVKNKDGESTSNELRFQIVTPDPEAPAKLAEYISKIGKGEAHLRVNYEAQSELEMEAEKQEQLISKEQAADTAKEDGAMAAGAGGGRGRKKKSD